MLGFYKGTIEKCKRTKLLWENILNILKERTVFLADYG
jgi:hypothetical protein